MKDLINKVRQHVAVSPTTVGAAAFVGGAVLAYGFQQYRINKLVDDFEEILLDIAAGLSEDQIPVEKPQPVVVDEEEYNAAREAARANHPSVRGPLMSDPMHNDDPAPEEETPEEDDVVVNIFGDSEDEWDMEAEMAGRNTDAPYVLHVEEFLNDERGFAQTTLTFYEGDEILTDDKDVPIYNKDKVVGDLPFGHGSNDRNVVYIRNEQLRAEFEILRDSGTYEHQVLGIDVDEEFARRDLKHAHLPRYRGEA